MNEEQQYICRKSKKYNKKKKIMNMYTCKILEENNFYDTMVVL